MKVSFISLSTLAIASIASALPTSLTARAADSCPANALSCSSTAGGSCCSPTNGLLILVQQWVQGFGPSTSFTMHGLWPDTCSGGQTGNNGCDPSRQYTNLDSILQGNSSLYNDMETYWPSYKGASNNGDFWTHEWGKHGTCVSTLAPQCYTSYTKYEDVYDYFGTALELRQKYDLYSILKGANITPGGSYSANDFESAIQSSVGVKPKVTCSGSDLEEVWIYFNVKNTNQYVPVDSVDSSTCSGDINYPTK
ncbi:RNase Sy [Halteromyces radiatus]|uniref:RNase Sy n=1 Tax=Halteromyces radiatus TaxID=101107 RepID=UPI00221EC6CA|nr:RNase Sy [Halteromyces radiatus]KAI8093097.1 RNase Sy [Halteromyces radiatus]